MYLPSQLLEHQHTVNVAGFDNAGLAMLSVWQALTLTGWVFMMYRTIDTYSLYVVIYYLTLVVIGAYFVVRACLEFAGNEPRESGAAPSPPLACTAPNTHPVARAHITPPFPRPLQLNLFLAVLKIKFAKAQTLFHNQLALQRGKARRNSIMTFMSRVQTKWTEYSSKRSQVGLETIRLLPTAAF